MDYRVLRELFESCLGANYRHTENMGSFYSVRDGDVFYLFFEKSYRATRLVSGFHQNEAITVLITGSENALFG